jgi:2-methylisocitrate lyase-like PEP mutase family enzyme
MTPPERLRRLLAQPGFLSLPAVWDGLSARLAADAGFEAVFLSGMCVAASRLGGPDLDMLSFGEMLDSLRMAREAAHGALVLGDGDHGFGNAINVQRTVRAYGEAGAAAVMIEDKITPRQLGAEGKPCLPREEARIKIRAAVEAARESGILVLARTDCRPTLGLDEALARIALFVDLGADMVLLDAPADEAEMRLAVAAARGRPAFCVMAASSANGAPSPRRAAELGFRLGTMPTTLLSPAMAGIQAGLAAMAAGDSAAPSALAPAQLRTVLGYTDYAERARALIAQA